MRDMSYFTPHSLDEAWDTKKQEPNSAFIAGGTDILVKIKDGATQPSSLISLRSIPELHGITNTNGLTIGAMTTITEIVEHPIIQSTFPVLMEAAQSLGSRQIRNVATIGGNICNSSPCANMAPPLLVLDTVIELKSPSGNRTLPLHEFFSGPGENTGIEDEIVTFFHVPIPSATTKAVFYKKGRVKMDIAVANFALLLDIKDSYCRKARFATGSVAPIPQRLFSVEKLLEGTKLSQVSIGHVQQSVLENISPISDIRSTEEYRQHIIQIYVKKALEKLLEWK